MSPRQATIAGLLRERAQATPDNLFLWIEDDRMTFGQVDGRSDRVAAGLAELGVERGERVAMLAPNRLELLELYFAAAKLGAIQVPLNAFLKGEFLRHQLADSEATTMVVDRAGYRQATAVLDQLGAVKRIVLLDDDPETEIPSGIDVVSYRDLAATTRDVPCIDLSPDDVMSIVYTSGTTGPAKGCVLTHGYYLRVARAADAVCELRDDDVLLSPLPLFHGAARMMVVANALHRGLAAVLEPQFHHTLLARAAETGATVLAGVAAIGRLLLAQPPTDADRAHRLRLATWGPADEQLEREVQRRFGFTVISQLYGQTECALSTFSPPSNAAMAGSAGRVAPDLEMILVDDHDDEVAPGDVGEICLRPRHRHAMFNRYWNRAEETLHTFRGLWYHTGDYGRLTGDGSLFFVDRKKDYLRRRGENVSSMEVEASILMHAKVAEVAVHAVPSELTEDDIKACVVVVPDVKLDPDELLDFLTVRIPYFALPRYVEVLPELPKNAVGRVLKFELRERGITSDTWDLEQRPGWPSRGDRR